MEPNYEMDRKAAMEWARDLLRRDDWVILDTETTGLETDAQAVQIAVVSHAGEVLCNCRLKPTVPIPESATAIHGIRDADVVSCPRFWDAWRLLRPLLKDKLIVAYNADFDRRILAQTAAKFGVHLPEAAWTCAMERYAAYVGEWNDHRGNYRWQKLPRVKVPPPPYHSGVEDCISTLAVIRLMADGLP